MHTRWGQLNCSFAHLTMVCSNYDLQVISCIVIITVIINITFITTCSLCKNSVACVYVLIRKSCCWQLVSCGTILKPCQRVECHVSRRHYAATHYVQDGKVRGDPIWYPSLRAPRVSRWRHHWVLVEVRLLPFLTWLCFFLCLSFASWV